MNKKEKETIMWKYAEILAINEKFDKKDAIFEIKSLMKLLNLENEMKIVENQHFVVKNNLNLYQKEGYSTLCDIIMQYNGGKVIEYQYIKEYFDEFWFDMSEEHQKCSNACLNLIDN